MIHRPRDKKPFERLAGEEIQVVSKHQQYLLSGLFFDLKQKKDQSDPPNTIMKLLREQFDEQSQNMINRLKKNGARSKSRFDNKSSGGVTAE